MAKSWVRVSSACAAGLALLLSGCTTPRSRVDTASPPTTAGDSYYGTELALGDCVMRRGAEAAFLPIAGALITGAVNQGVSRIGAALKDAAQPHTSKLFAERNVQLTEAELAGHHCIHIVRGWFYRDPAYDSKKPFNAQTKLVEAQARLAGSFVTADQLEWFWGNGLWLAGPPEFVFEGILGQAVDDKSARFVYPLYVRMEQPAESRPLRPDGARHVMVFLGFETVDNTLNVESTPGATLTLGRMQPGKSLEFPLRASLPGRVLQVCADQLVAPANATMASTTPATSSGLPVPGSGMPAATVTGTTAPGTAAACVNRVDAVAAPFESDWFKLQLGTAPTPLRVKSLVTETQGGSEFLAFVADVFEGAQGTIKTELDAAVNPVTRAQREAEARTTEEGALDKLDASLAAVIKSLKSCASGTADLPGLASSARKAMRDYNSARRALRDGPVFGDRDFDAIQINGSDADIKKGCSQALGRLGG